MCHMMVGAKCRVLVSGCTLCNMFDHKSVLSELDWIGTPLASCAENNSSTVRVQCDKVGLIYDLYIEKDAAHKYNHRSVNSVQYNKSQWVFLPLEWVCIEQHGSCSKLAAILRHCFFKEQCLKHFTHWTIIVSLLQLSLRS